MRYKSLFHQSPIYYQLAKLLATQDADALSKPQEQLVFFSVNLLGQCDVNGHAAINLNEYAGRAALLEHDIEFEFPALNVWKAQLQDAGVVENLCLVDEASGASGAALCDLMTQLELSDKALCLMGDVLYLSKTAYIELGLAQQFIERAQLRLSIPESFLSSPLLGEGQFELLNDIHQADDIDWQEVAVNNSVLSPLSFIVGGPGTGKTTTVAKIVERVFSVSEALNEPLNIAFAAPTGKAAARLHSSLLSNLSSRLSEENFTRLSESLPHSASTLHRLLAWHAGRASFGFNQHNKLAYNCIIVDEISMIDTSMFYYLLRAVDSNCRLILLGDPKQLASVQSGSVLSDLCHQDALMYFSPERSRLLQLGDSFSLSAPLPPLIDNIAYLRKSYRFDEKSGIGQLAKACQMGDLNKAYAAQSDSVVLLEKTDSNKHAVLQLAFEQHQAIIACETPEQALDRLTEFQILCAKREGEDSVELINNVVSHRLNANRKLEYIQGQKIYHGMPVIIQKNLYQQGLFNGDIGIAWRDESGVLAFYFSGEEQLKRFMPVQLSGWQAAHAMTVHKSQGSEYTQVVLWMPEANSPLLNKELFYTAVTRAKQRFTCLSDKAAIAASLNKSTLRFSKLTQLMKLYSSES